MKKGLIFTVMLVALLALGYSQTALSGTYRYSTNAYVTFTGNAFKGLWNATTPMSGTFSVSGSRLTLNITDGPKAKNTWAWTVVDANTLKDQDGDTWKKEGSGGTAQARTSPPVEWNVNSMAKWIEAVGGVRSGGNNKAYVITVTGDISVPVDTESTFGSVIGITVTIQGVGTLTPSGRGSVFIIGADQTVVLKGDITLKGKGNYYDVVRIKEKGIFRMEGNSTVGNEGDGNGVEVGDGGTFTMSGGTISGNISSGDGGGVYVYTGRTFTMSAGTISGNISNGNGGGVYVRWVDIFKKTGGTISGNDAVEADRNTAKQQGHAVHNGRNWRNATAGPRMNTDTYGFWLND